MTRKKMKKPAAGNKGKKCKKSVTEQSPGEGSTGPKGIDWVKAKRLYITCSQYLTHESLLEHLVDHSGDPVTCNVSVLHRRASKEQWARQRKEYVAGVTADFLKVIGERYVLARKASLDQLQAVREYLVNEILSGRVEKVAVSDLLAAIKTEVTMFEGKDTAGELVVNVHGKQEGQGLEHVKKALLSALKDGKLTKDQLRKAVTK